MFEFHSKVQPPAVAALLKRGLGTLVFFFGLAHAQAQTNTITLYFYPSPKGIEWNGPRGLTLSAYINQEAYSPYARPTRIGHAQVEVQCQGTENSSALHILSGTTSVDSSTEQELLFKQQVGLGILFYDFLGREESPSEIEAAIAERAGTRDISSFTIQVSADNCQRVAAYYQAYKSKNLHEHYGLSLRPRFEEGGGCSAYAASFLDVAGVLEPTLWDKWGRFVRVPESFIGEPGRAVSIEDIFFYAFRWAKKTEPHLELKVWDPDRMHKWVLEKVRKFSRLGAKERYELSEQRGVKGISWDRREVAPSSDPLFFD